MSREEGMHLVEGYEGKRPPSLDLFLDFIGLSEEEFVRIARSHEVSPHQHNDAAIQPGKKLHDFEQWSREGKMDRAEAEKQLKQWTERQSF